MAREIRGVAPCPLRWSELKGGGPQRYCSQCGRHVHDFSTLTRRQIHRLLAKGGRVCGLLRHDAQGRLITRPPLWKRVGSQVAALSVLIQPGSCDDGIPTSIEEQVCEQEEPVEWMGGVDLIESQDLLYELGYLEARYVLE